MQQTIILAYCQTDENQAQQIKQHLEWGGYDVQETIGTKNPAGEPLAVRLLNQRAPIILLVSPDFLKNTQCMNQSLQLVQQKKSDLFVVQIPVADEAGHAIVAEYDKASDIIKYINYWQDQYLDLRKQKREIQGLENEESFQQYFKMMRDISGEVGEFLRLLRLVPHYHADTLVELGYKPLFEQFLSNAAATTAFKAQHLSLQSMDDVLHQVANTPDEEPEMPAIDLTEIPGINLVTQAEDTTDTISTLEPVDEPEFISVPSEDLQAAAVLPVENIEALAGEPDTSLDVSAAFDEAITGVESHIADTSLDPTPNPIDEINVPELTSSEEIPMDVQATEIPKEEEELFVFADSAEVNSSEAGNIEVAAKDLAESDTFAALLEQVDASFDQGDRANALALLEEAIQENPNHAPTRYHYALCLMDDLRMDDAARQLETTVLLDDKHADAYFVLGQIASFQQTAETAEKQYRNALAIDPEHLEATQYLGYLLAWQENPLSKQEALVLLKRVIKLNPANAEALYQYGLLQLEFMHQPYKAIKRFQQALRINPEHASAWYDLANAYKQVNEQGQASEAYERAVSLVPEYQSAEMDAYFQTPQPLPIMQENIPSAASVEVTTIEAIKENIRNLELLLERAQIVPEPVVASVPAIDFKNSIVFISGATSGIGLATAEIFAANGYKLILNGRRYERLLEIEKHLQQMYQARTYLACFDVRDQAAMYDVLGQIPAEWQTIDILVNNAGKAKGLDPIHKGEVVHWEEMIDTNVKGLLYLTRAISPQMVARRKGHIINVSSTAGKEVYPNGNVYCATKFAVEALTKAFRLDFYQHNVRVSQVSPAAVEDTEFSVVRFDGDTNRAASIYDGFQPLKASDVAETIYFIATRAPYINIQDIQFSSVQQAAFNLIDRSGRDQYKEEE